MTELQNQLIALGACPPAVSWLSTLTLQEAWLVCENPYWLWWLLDRCAPTGAVPPSVLHDDDNDSANWIRLHHTCPTTLPTDQD